MQQIEELAERLLLACSELTRSVTAAAPGTALSLTQARVLGTLDRHGPSRISRLAALERCAQPSMTTLVTRLADAGLVTRGPDPDDARAVLVTLTPRGGEELLADRQRLSEPLAAALRALPGERRDDLAAAVAVLTRLTGDVRSATPGA